MHKCPLNVLFGPLTMKIIIHDIKLDRWCCIPEIFTLKKFIANGFRNLKNILFHVEIFDCLFRMKLSVMLSTFLINLFGRVSYSLAYHVSFMNYFDGSSYSWFYDYKRGHFILMPFCDGLKFHTLELGSVTKSYLIIRNLWEFYLFNFMFEWINKSLDLGYGSRKIEKNAENNVEL